ncbi:MAG TPA: isocitrate lyase/PEP mutase family protein [Acidimicrobiales bacterium]|nr:isocitrate lyase/PEP mutase family protein [Acidimicrobiales bacterium]
MAEFLAPAADTPRRLRDLLSDRTPVLAPGVYDALGARLVEEAGFDAVYMTGFGTAAGLLGRPDVGLLTMTEMVDNAHRIARATSLPLIADADTGYGNAINVVRTVQEYEQAGVAALHLEDQVMPKRCGHMEGKQVVPADEMVTKVRAAVAARSSDDLVIIARTDAGAVEGFDAAIERARRYRDAGADVLFVEAATTEAEVERIATELDDVPLLFNWAEGGKTPPLPLDRIRELGFAIVIFPVGLLLATVQAARATLAAIKGSGTPLPVLDRLLGFGDFLGFIGLPEIRALEQRFVDPAGE